MQISNLVSKTQISNLVSKTQISNLVSKTQISNLVSKTYMQISNLVHTTRLWNHLCPRKSILSFNHNYIISELQKSIINVSKKSCQCQVILYVMTCLPYMVIPCFQWSSCCSKFSFLCSVLQIVVCPFFLAIVLSVLL